MVATSTTGIRLPEEQAGRLRYGMSVVGGERSGEVRPPVAQASRLHLDPRVQKEQAGRLRYGMSVVGGKRSGEVRPPVAQASRLHLDPRVQKEQAGRLRYGMSVVGGKRSGEMRLPVAQASRLHPDPRVAPPPRRPSTRFGRPYVSVHLGHTYRPRRCGRVRVVRDCGEGDQPVRFRPDILIDDTEIPPCVFLSF